MVAAQGAPRQRGKSGAGRDRAVPHFPLRLSETPLGSRSLFSFFLSSPFFFLSSSLLISRFFFSKKPTFPSVFSFLLCVPCFSPLSVSPFPLFFLSLPRTKKARQNRQGLWSREKTKTTRDAQTTPCLLSDLSGGVTCCCCCRFSLSSVRQYTCPRPPTFCPLFSFPFLSGHAKKKRKRKTGPRLFSPPQTASVM